MTSIRSVYYICSNVFYIPYILFVLHVIYVQHVL